MATALVVGGTGPTGPPIVRGLADRGYAVTVLHSGAHEVAEVSAKAGFRHLHGDVFSAEGIRAAVGNETFDLVVVSYGRLRAIAEFFVGRAGRLISIGGAPAYHGFFDPDALNPPGLPVPTPEDSVLATEDADGKSYRVARTEAIVFELHPTASHFRYPYVYGPRQLAPREWCIVRRILDRRPVFVLPDDGLSLITYGYTDNLAHALLLAVDHPEASMGEVFNAGDDEKLTIRQVVEVITEELAHDWELLSMPAHLAIPAHPLIQCHRTTHRCLDTSKLRVKLGYRDVVPAREAVGLAARWLVENPPERGGFEESALQDPFNYDAEDRLTAWWRNAIADPPDLGYTQLPGYGKSYAGPGARRVRPDTRI
jgi:nucleoside-diphosphate-sugar epimerase